jgi:hypothetical protein
MEQLDLFTGKVSEQNSSFPYYRFDTPDELELLLSRLTIVEVGLFYLRDKIKKRPVSPNYKGLCPFHKERTPSFYVMKVRESVSPRSKERGLKRDAF